MWHVITKFSTVLPREGRNAYRTGLPPVVSPLLCQQGDPMCFPSVGIMCRSMYAERLTTWQNALTQQPDLSLVGQINPPGWSGGSGARPNCGWVRLRAKSQLPTLGWPRGTAVPMRQASFPREVEGWISAGLSSLWRVTGARRKTFRELGGFKSISAALAYSWTIFKLFSKWDSFWSDHNSSQIWTVEDCTGQNTA